MRFSLIWNEFRTNIDKMNFIYLKKRNQVVCYHDDVFLLSHWKYNFPMSPHVRLRAVGWSVCHNFLKEWKVTLPCSHRIPCIACIYNIVFTFHFERMRPSAEVVESWRLTLNVLPPDNSISLSGNFMDPFTNAISLDIQCEVKNIRICDNKMAAYAKSTNNASITPV